MSDTTLRRWRSQDALDTNRPHVSRHPVREVNVYEVKEYELEQLSNAAHTPTHQRPLVPSPVGHDERLVRTVRQAAGDRDRDHLWRVVR